MIIMSKRKKPSNLFRTSRSMGRKLGSLVLESKERSKVLARKGKKGLEATSESLSKAGKKAGKKARTTTQETIPQMVKAFRRGLKEGMKK